MDITRARPRLRVVVILGVLSALPALSIDLYLPAVPAMAGDLDTGAGVVQLTVTAFVAGLALGQLVAGPLSDAYGRRPLLLGGLALHVAGSLACLVAPTMTWFVLARVAQALGAAAATVLARAVARDHVEGAELSRLVSALMLVNGVATVVGPVLGGQLLVLAPWRSLFLGLGLVGCALLAVVVLALPESLASELRRPARVRPTAAAFARLLGDRAFLRYALSAALVFAAAFAYISGSSYVLQDAYGLSAQQYSLVFAVVAAGIMVLGQANARVVGRLAGEQALLGAGLVLAAVAGVGVLLCVLASAPLAVLLGCLLLVVASLGPVLANATSLALAPHPASAGTAASLIGVLQYAVSGGVASVMSLVADDARSAAVAMAWAMALSAVAGLAVFALGAGRGVGVPRSRGATAVPLLAPRLSPTE